MKILVLGDIHGRPFWKQIIEKEQPDKTIFLGDFVTTHELYTPAMQIQQTREIIELKEQNPDKYIICRGNHDLDALGYYWARCYPAVDSDVREVMDKNTEFGQRFLNATQWFHIEFINNVPTIFVHAGITRDWLERIFKYDISSPELITKALVDICKMDPSENFGFTGGRWDNYGTDPQQSCVWVRPETLGKHAIPGYDFVVGHTGTYGPCISEPILKEVPHEKNGEKFSTWDETDNVIWMCDALQQKAYLIIEDGNYIPKQL